MSFFYCYSTYFILLLLFLQDNAPISRSMVGNNRLSESFHSTNVAAESFSSPVSLNFHHHEPQQPQQVSKEKNKHCQHSSPSYTESASSVSISPAEKERGDTKHDKTLDTTPTTPSVISQTSSTGKDKDRKEGKTSDKEKEKKNRKAWYNVLSRNYKHRSEELKRLFKDLPPDERLIVGEYNILFLLLFFFCTICFQIFYFLNFNRERRMYIL